VNVMDVVEDGYESEFSAFMIFVFSLLNSYFIMIAG